MSDDKAIRDAAVAARTNVVVTAGAGTGKTTLLVNTALSRILDDGIDVRRLLLLTFTDKAANEMRIRLRAELEKKDRTGRVKDALEGLDRAQIGTIHGFCAHLLREFPVEAGLDPRFVVDEGARFREIFDREWQRWLTVELAADSPHREAWLRVLSVAPLWQLAEIARGLCEFRVPAAALDAAASRRRGRAALDDARKELADELARRAKPCDKEWNNLLRHMKELERYLREGGDGFFLEKAYVSEDKRGWTLEDYDAARAAVFDARALAKDIAAMDELRVGDATGLLCDFARRFRAAFTAEGCVSFDGLLALAHELLTSETYPSIRARVRERFDAILVDEFQDTDPIQCEIILALAQDEARTLRPGRLFIVGDPKQSIYSFRGADIIAYERVKERMIAAGAEEFVLRTNFRSHAGILDLVNELFARVIRKRSNLQPAYEPIAPEPGRTPPPGASVRMVLFDADSVEDSRRAEAEYAAKWIKDNVTRFSDVAVLLKALTDAHIYLEAMRAHGVPYVVEGEKFFYGAPEVIDFSNLLHAIADPNDAIALAGLLRSPFGAVDDRALYELTVAGRLDYRTRPDDPHVARLYATLTRLRARSRELGVAELIDEIFATTFVLELAASGYGGEQAVANLLKIRQRARDLRPPGLGAFLKTLREAIRTMEEEGESPLADETLDAVRVLSIHKAKGLEFPVVILPDLHRETQGRPGGGRPGERPVRYDWPTRTLGVRLGDKCDAGAAALALREAQRREEEDRRVPYVALTRARERMILLGSAQFSRASFLGLLARAIQSAGGPTIEACTDPVVRVGGASFELAREAWLEPERPPREEPPSKAAPDDWSFAAATWRRRDAEYARALASPRFTSPSRLQAEKHKAMLATEDEEELEFAAKVGTLCHRVMEHIDFKRPKVVVEPGPEADEAKHVMESFVKSPAFAELARSQILARELPFVMRRDGGVLTGVIDLVYKTGDRVWVADYKSDRVEKPEMYAEQKRAYVEAVERTLGVRVAGFRLIYLRSGRVIEL